MADGELFDAQLTPALNLIPLRSHVVKHGFPILRDARAARPQDEEIGQLALILRNRRKAVSRRTRALIAIAVGPNPIDRRIALARPALFQRLQRVGCYGPAK